MALPKKAIKILRDVQKCILAEPELYDQGEFPARYKGHTCDTPCCFSGWVEWVVKPDKAAYIKKLRRVEVFGIENLAETLGIEVGQAARLFGNYNPATQKGIMSAVEGAARIDLFIESGGHR